jgi:hypothetical protein
MTTPQSPGGGDTPQDPSDPQNPYAPPPPPATSIPPAPSPYGEPAAPPPPAPAAPGAPQPPPYGQPGYAQPGYAQPAYAQVPYGAPAPAAPGRGMAITSLILSCLCCLSVVGIPLAIVVLVRSRNGENHGKGLAIASLIIGVISLLATVGIVVSSVLYFSAYKSVNELEAGDCISANGLTDQNADSVDSIHTVSCSDKHDGEVLAITEVTAELADDFGSMDPQTTCTPAIEAAGKTSVVTEGITVTALTVSDPAVGDNIACVAYRTDGTSLTGKLGS